MQGFPGARLSALVGVRSEDSSVRAIAWEAIAAAYWNPSAKDLVQSFFARAMERGLFAAYGARKGTFRTYVRSLLDNFAAHDMLIGGALGILDGLKAWFTPEVRAGLLSIVIGSTVKGLIAGILIGYFAKKVNSLLLGLIFGLAIAALLAFGIAASQHGHYFAIILPGSLVGVITGTPHSGTNKSDRVMGCAAHTLHR